MPEHEDAQFKYPSTWTTNEPYVALRGSEPRPIANVASFASRASSLTEPFQPERPADVLDTGSSSGPLEAAFLFSPKPKQLPDGDDLPSSVSQVVVKPDSRGEILESLPTHTSGELSEDKDEYIPLIKDDSGERKIDCNGQILGGRKYNCRTFRVPNRGPKLFMLATECARILGYQDSHMLFNNNRSLFKIIVNETEKHGLIHQEMLPSSYRSCQIVIVTARSMFRQFGSRLIQGGRRVRDDYWEERARKHGFTEDNLPRLARYYDALGDSKRAAEMEEQCWATRRRQLGKEHPHTLISMSNLARYYDALGDSKRAAEMEEQCWAVRRRQLGEEHPHTLISMSNLARYYNALGDSERAAEMGEQCWGQEFLGAASTQDVVSKTPPTKADDDFISGSTMNRLLGTVSMAQMSLTIREFREALAEKGSEFEENLEKTRPQAPASLPAVTHPGKHNMNSPIMHERLLADQTESDSEHSSSFGHSPLEDIHESIMHEVVSRLLKLYSSPKAPNAYVRTRTHQGQSSNDSTAQAETAQNGGCTDPTGSSGIACKQSKRPLQDSNDDEDGKRRRPTEKQPTGASDAANDFQLLACPFYKHDSHKYRTCGRSVLKNISRVKYHLRRCHQAPIHCERCSMVFVDESERKKHLRQATPCELMAMQDWPGISEANLRELSKRTSSKRSTREKWYDIFGLLFPLSPPPDSPYLDGLESQELREIVIFAQAEGPAIVDELMADLPENQRVVPEDAIGYMNLVTQEFVNVLFERWEALGRRLGGPAIRAETCSQVYKDHQNPQYLQPSGAYMPESVPDPNDSLTSLPLILTPGRSSEHSNASHRQEALEMLAPQLRPPFDASLDQHDVNFEDMSRGNWHEPKPRFPLPSPGSSDLYADMGFDWNDNLP